MKNKMYRWSSLSVLFFVCGVLFALGPIWGAVSQSTSTATHYSPPHSTTPTWWQKAVRIIRALAEGIGAGLGSSPKAH